MILSVSRRTDIPAFYMDWFLNRQEAGFVYTRNPMNRKQVSKISFSDVSCYVFWTKNPKYLLKHYDKIEKPFMLQVTITPYGSDVESSEDKQQIINDVIEITKRIGKERVRWRYDPILFTEKYTVAYHLRAFEKLCQYFEGILDQCIFSFVEVYKKVAKALKHLDDTPDRDEFVKMLVKIANGYGIELLSCGEYDGVKKANCINKSALNDMKVFGYKKDKYQRASCGCIESVDIGAYNTCVHKCIYCYANHQHDKALEFYNYFNPLSPILGAPLWGDETIKEKIIHRNLQLELNL